MITSSRKRILFVAQEFIFGGAAWLALRHMRRMLSRYEIDLLVTGRWEEGMLRQLPGGVSVFKLDANSVEQDAHALSPRIYLKLCETPLLQRNYDAALGTSLFPDLGACVAMFFVKAGRKLLFLVDEGLAGYPQLGLQERKLIDRCLGVADLVVSVSRRLFESMGRECPPLLRCTCEVLHPPIDVDQILLRSREQIPDWKHGDLPAVLTVARLVNGKQIMRCLHVHHQLRLAGVEFHWYVMGTGPEEAALRAKIKKYKMADVFHLIGNRENVFSWMKRCDLFALFSASEGCPTVVIEALLLGCPVIMTDVNGADELIENGRTGLIVQNNQTAITEGLSKLLKNAGLLELFRCNIAADPVITDAAKETTWLVERIEQPRPVPKVVAEATQPKVSILVPTFNHERHIDLAIASALMQDFPSLEVIVADDASTDRTEAVARNREHDPRFRYLRNDHNIGRVANYRKALTEHARGEWVLLLDGDDYLCDPGFISDAMEALRRHADHTPLFAQAGHRVHYVHRERKDVDIKPPIEGPEQLMTGGEYLRCVFKSGFFTHLGTLYNRKAAIENQFYTANISSSDMDSLLRLALDGKVLVLNKVAGCWVQHGGNASSNLPLEEIPANARIFRRITEMAVGRGLTSMREMSGVLTRYEAQTLIHLFGQAMGKTLQGPLDAVKMAEIVISVNPRLLWNERLMRYFLLYVWSLSRRSFKRYFSVPAFAAVSKEQGGVGE